ncbi:OsmC family peroxiredoxin [Brumimicrobium glaciale]|uniref:OsmC family peroxiredoxin n=1 Tax=Brumimicrobium glaciale TaxID=200475 RepID=A0A4Q4KF54_9FLAO|nr:OsmC family protein [Brumimicrobium glaciale]RYM31290.1 OsmC family peroxiredoxin [Brumimicrobium glaciale]
MKIKLDRKNEFFHFTAQNESGLSLEIDGSPEIGGENKGFRPMELMLSGIASCSTIDLLLILKKQKQVVEDISIETSGERSESDAKEFKSVHLHYILTGAISSSKLERAIDLAITKYCSALLSLDPNIEVTSSYEIQ